MSATDSAIVRSVVMIDDDADFLHLVKRNLHAQRAEFAPTGPVEISTFTDAVEALVNLPAEGICVVILDFSMPGSTGLDWLPKVLQAGLGPVILLTNNNDAKGAADAFRGGAADYIAKTELLADDKRLARAIREAVHRYRLESRNSLLTRQLKLLNIELEGKNKRLRELTETAHRFVDDVAHDFRTPLTVIQQYSSLVADGLSGPVTAVQRNHLEVVGEATQDLSEMVDDFLDSSKLRARALSVHRQAHTATELFDQIDPVLNVRAAPKQIRVERLIADNTPRFFGDLSKATRVLTNLVVNAIKATPASRRLQLWAKPTESGDVRVGVTDQGPGLKPDDVKIIFDRFQQVGEEQLTDSKGFGLGLSIVKQLTWLNLGRIEVQSEFGKGSTFSFTLPAFDLHRILTSYLENMSLPEDAGDYWMLHIRADAAAPEAPMLFRIISSFCYPTDLVLQDKDGPGVTALGISRDANAWANRLQERTRQFNSSVGEKQSSQLEINVEGPWLRDGDGTKLFDTLLGCLSPGGCHV